MNSTAGFAFAPWMLCAAGLSDGWYRCFISALWVLVKISSLYKKEFFVSSKSCIFWNCYFTPKQSKPTDELNYLSNIGIFYSLLILGTGQGVVEWKVFKVLVPIKILDGCVPLLWQSMIDDKVDRVSLPNSFAYLFVRNIHSSEYLLSIWQK